MLPKINDYPNRKNVNFTKEMKNDKGKLYTVSDAKQGGKKIVEMEVRQKQQQRIYFWNKSTTAVYCFVISSAWTDADSCGAFCGWRREYG